MHGPSWAWAVPAVAIAALVAVPSLAVLAWLIVTYRFPGRAVLEWALVLPLAYVIGFALLGLFDFTGPVQGVLRRWIGPGARLPEFRSYWGVVLTMTMRAFVAVTLPLARPSLVAGVALATMEALADFGTVATFGYRTLTEAVYRVWYGMFDRAAVAQLASLLLLLALCLLALERSLRGRARFTQNQRRGPPA